MRDTPMLLHRARPHLLIAQQAMRTVKLEMCIPILDMSIIILEMYTPILDTFIDKLDICVIILEM